MIMKKNLDNELSLSWDSNYSAAKYRWANSTSTLAQEIYSKLCIARNLLSKSSSNKRKESKADAAEIIQLVDFYDYIITHPKGVLGSYINVEFHKMNELKRVFDLFYSGRLSPNASSEGNCSCNDEQQQRILSKLPEFQRVYGKLSTAYFV